LIIVEYNPEWANNFEKIKEKLLDSLIGLRVTIEHIGSTSVRGLAAKPIIDIDIIYREVVEFESIKNSLESFGYYHSGNQDVEGREVFKRNRTGEDAILDKIAHHLYVCKYDCPELHRHILFRNYLSKYDISRNFYMNLKYEMAKEAKEDRKVYADIKGLKASSFINYIIELSALENDGFDGVIRQ
jgi:GrpB-like predicted nucleotidyltransferase (UPF0157 family)